MHFVSRVVRNAGSAGWNWNCRHASRPGSIETEEMILIDSNVVSEVMSRSPPSFFGLAPR